MWGVLEQIVGSHIPRKSEGHSWECVLDVPVANLNGRSFQEWVIRQPVRFGGFGLRSQIETSPVAFIGALRQILPSFSGEKGICPQLEHLISPNSKNIWQPLIESRCRTGMELQKAWTVLQKEAQEISDYLGVELEGVLSVSELEVGEGYNIYKVRNLMTEQCEKIKGQLIGRSLELHLDRKSRPVLAWPQMDKLSAAWLLALPGPHTGLSNSIFSEAACKTLCLPSPSCRDRIGEKVGRVVVDEFGDKIMAAPLPGDTWRIRHDAVKSELNRLFHWSGIPAVCEVFGLFAHLIPQEGLNRLERGRKRQGLVPDFQLHLTSQTGGVVSRLAELKVLNCCPTRYHYGDTKRAVERRAGSLQSEYNKKAKDTDLEYCGTVQGEAGPVQTKLKQFEDIKGLVVGAFGEGSKDLHEMVQTISENRIKSIGLSRGKQLSKNELGNVVGQVRRMLSVTCVRAQAQCLLMRMSFVGEGVSMAIKRRQVAANQEVMMRREREAQWFSRVRGRNVMNRGHFLLN